MPCTTDKYRWVARLPFLGSEITDICNTLWPVWLKTYGYLPSQRALLLPFDQHLFPSHWG